MIRISHIEVENFKSLAHFNMDLSQFNCLIGLNGAGKSTVLQFMDFLSQVVSGDMKQWFDERKWNPTDIKSKLSKKRYVEWRIFFSDSRGDCLGYWEASYNPSENRCVKEAFQFDYNILLVSGEGLTVHREGEEPWAIPITFEYQGSILSGLKEELVPSVVLECKYFFDNIKSLELLSPENLRQRSRESHGTLGLGGKNLSAFIHEMPPEKRILLNERLKKAYSHLSLLRTKSIQSGWKQLEITENYNGAEFGLMPIMVTEARHINDGMLRLIAMISELNSDHEFMIFDEIENGINPELVDFVINELVSSDKQILVTTHSPMILNYLEDEIAREGVIYLYKTRKGETKSIRFFDIPSVSEKLTVMGPGEAFVDTNLLELAAEIESVTEGQ